MVGGSGTVLMRDSNLKEWSKSAVAVCEEDPSHTVGKSCNDCQLSR